MDISTIIGLITGGLTIVGAIIALTRYLTNLQTQVKIERLESQNQKSEQTIKDLAAKNKFIAEELTAARKTGSALSAQKAEMDQLLMSIMSSLEADAGSIYIPLFPSEGHEANGLVFLAINPINEHTERLRKQVIPLKSLVGRCYRTEKPFVVGNSKTNEEHYTRADDISGFRTQDSLNYPIKYNETVVGVLQLLNKKDEKEFTELDIQQVDQLSHALSQKIDNFLRTPKHLDVLGIAQQNNYESATVLFCDLTSSSTLFDELNVTAAIQHINEYFEKVCDVAFANGATVDKYMGDGVLLRFNVPHPVKEHPEAAIKTAFQIQKAFEELKQDWLMIGGQLEGIFSRIGLSYGKVQKAIVGHPQYQYLTLFGDPVNTSAKLCSIASRDRNIIVIDEQLYKHVEHRVQVEDIPDNQLGGAKRYTNQAYEVKNLILS